MKRLTILLHFILLTLIASAVQQIDTWRVYLSYYNATQNEVIGNTVYSLMNGNLLSYDMEDGEVCLYDHLDKLSGTGISRIVYNPNVRKLLIVYKDSNIDLLDRDGNVTSMSALKDKSIADKEVTYVALSGQYAYLVTGFGFVVVDMKEGVFLNSYRLSFDISSIAASDEAVYIGTSDGIYYCKMENNMQIEENWVLRLGIGGFKNMVWYQNRLMALNPDHLWALDPFEYNQPKYCSGKFTYLHLTNGRLIWGNATQVGYTDDIEDEPTIIDYAGSWNDVSYGNGLFWFSEGEQGLRSYKYDGTTFIHTGTVIQPSTPRRDLSYHINWSGDRLLVAGGVNTVSSYYNPPTAMCYDLNKDEWTNFVEYEKPAELPRMNLYNTTNVVQDPKDPTHHFASLYRSGLCEYRDGKCVNLYNSKNSPLKSILPSSSRYYNYVSCSALSYDAQGNLWMANTQVDTVFHVLKPNGTWLNLYYEDIAQCSLIDQILHHSSGLVFAVSRRIDYRGLFCLDTKGTDKASDDRHILHQNIVNQDGTPYSPDNFLCVAEDLDGVVWLGTSSGLFVVEDPSQVFSTDYRFTQVKINRNDGSGLADYLFNDVAITAIAADAANRKWIGTDGGGLYLISGDGQEQIHHFTTENSPLLSDVIQDIAVHPATGSVMIATDKGLCSYMSDATAPEEDLAKSNVTVFPNPVTADYSGPIIIRGLTANAEVKIVTTGGQLIWSGVSNGGSCSWNGLTSRGQRVTSGLYHVIANTEDGNKAVVTRIVIAR